MNRYDFLYLLLRGNKLRIDLAEAFILEDKKRRMVSLI
jgi:hypothetical protein